MTERIMRETREIIERTFTTEPKRRIRRGNSPVRNRCIEFIEILKELGYTNTIPLEHAKELFQAQMGIMDRTSLKAYFGSQASRNIRKIQRTARYATGTMSFRTIELAQDVPHRTGYFEILRLATFEKKGKTWFMNLANEPLIAELGFHTYEGSEQSNADFSLPPLLQGKEREKTVLEVVSPNDVETTERTQTHTLQGEREKLSLDFVAETVDVNIQNMLADIQETANSRVAREGDERLMAERAIMDPDVVT
jgi:hypothetical protein